MLLKLLKLWQSTIIKGQVVGLYISARKVVMYSPYHNFETKSWSPQSSEISELAVEEAISHCVSLFRNRFKKWPILKFLISIEGDISIFNKNYLDPINKKLNVILYRVDYEMVLAIGNELEVTSAKKQLVVLLDNKCAYGFNLFAANIFSKARSSYNAEGGVSNALHNTIEKVLNTTEASLLVHYSKLELSEVDKKEIEIGWHKPYSKNISIINIGSKPLIEETLRPFKDYKYAIINENFQLVDHGMKAVVENYKLLNDKEYT